MQEPAWVKLPSVVLRLLQVWGALVYAVIHALLIGFFFYTVTRWSVEGDVMSFLSPLVGFFSAYLFFLIVTDYWGVSVYTNPGAVLLDIGVDAIFFLWTGFVLLPLFLGIFWITPFINKLPPVPQLLVLVVFALSFFYFIGVILKIIAAEQQPENYRQTYLMRCWNWYKSILAGPLFTRNIDFEYMDGKMIGVRVVFLDNTMEYIERALYLIFVGGVIFAAFHPDSSFLRD